MISESTITQLVFGLHWEIGIFPQVRFHPHTFDRENSIKLNFSVSVVTRRHIYNLKMSQQILDLSQIESSSFDRNSRPTKKSKFDRNVAVVQQKYTRGAPITFKVLFN